VQAAEQRAEVTGRLPGIGVREHDQRLVQRDDQGQEGRGQAPVACGRHPALAVTGVVGHVRPQRLGRPASAVLIDGGLVDNGLVDGGLVDGGLVDGRLGCETGRRYPAGR
jgi:hypothetical protein